MASLGSARLKTLSLATLTLQNSLLTILLHYSRSNDAQPYSAPAAVLLNEILKLLISLAIAVYNACLAASDSPGEHIYSHVPGDENVPSDTLRRPLIVDRSSPYYRHRVKRITHLIIKQSTSTLNLVISGDCWKLSIPAILYVIQNNLQFVAASNLDVATFSVTYQLKILTTALCSVIMLNRKLSTSKWLSLLSLAIGVALVQLSTISPTTPIKNDERTQNRMIGFISILLACLTSGLAGVYFELVLKSSSSNNNSPPIDIWHRNIQLSLFSILPALFTLLITSTSLNFWKGFGFWAWATVLTQVLGGLITALVIKFADNILKGFATSLSIVLSTLISLLFFENHHDGHNNNNGLSLGMVTGGLIVLLSTYTYNISFPSLSNSNSDDDNDHNISSNHGLSKKQSSLLPTQSSNKFKTINTWKNPTLSIAVEPLLSSSSSVGGAKNRHSVSSHQSLELNSPVSPNHSIQTSITSPHARPMTFFPSSSSSSINQTSDNLHSSTS